MKEPINSLVIPTPTEIAIVIKEPRLTPIEKLYIKSYITHLDHSKALRSLHPELKNFPSKNKYSKREAVNYHIQKYIVNRISSEGLNKESIIDLLLQEATRLGGGSSPTARVQALTLLGKELGLFQEKVIEKEELSFNIINYGTIETQTTKEVKVIEKEENSLPDNISLQTFE